MAILLWRCWNKFKWLTLELLQIDALCDWVFLFNIFFRTLWRQKRHFIHWFVIILIIVHKFFFYLSFFFIGTVRLNDRFFSLFIILLLQLLSQWYSFFAYTWVIRETWIINVLSYWYLFIYLDRLGLFCFNDFILVWKFYSLISHLTVILCCYCCQIVFSPLFVNAMSRLNMLKSLNDWLLILKLRYWNLISTIVILEHLIKLLFEFLNADLLWLLWFLCIVELWAFNFRT